MRPLLTLAMILFTLGLSAQQLADFKFVNVPLKFKDFKTNNAYNLNKILVSKLQDRQYQSSQEDIEQWASKMGEDACQFLSSEVVDTSTMFRNKVRLEFIDCNGRVVASFDGTSSIKAFHEGFQDALLKAIAQISTSTGKGVSLSNTKSSSSAGAAMVQSTKSITEGKSNRESLQSSGDKKEESVLTETTLSVTKSETPQSELFDRFTWNGATYTKVNLGTGHFILTQPVSTEPFAEFKETSKSGIYRVVIKGQESTIGYREGSNYVVEIKKEDGQFTNAIFVGQ